MACNYTILEQNGSYFLALKRIGEFPEKEEKITQTLRRGLQEVDISNKDSKETRNVRFRVFYDSTNRKDVEEMLKMRCSK